MIYVHVAVVKNSRNVVEKMENSISVGHFGEYLKTASISMTDNTIPY
jgi:hypothetical protein